jgi:hypothetical protein
MDENADRQFSAGEEHRYQYRDKVNRLLHRLTSNARVNADFQERF